LPRGDGGRVSERGYAFQLLDRNKNPPLTPRFRRHRDLHRCPEPPKFDRDRLPARTARTTDSTHRQASGAVVYLVHFSEPYRRARHYTDWTSDLESRLAEHRAGRGARLLAVITQAGIDWTLARTWQGTRQRERQLKRQGGASRRCPICRAERSQRDE
jgi:predicted GIY-YIG superfamily endonuclease